MRSFPADCVVTNEHRRFAECCDACRRYRYIGLCYGAPGVGKTLSAQCYANWFHLQAYAPSTMASPAALAPVAGSTTIFYTPEVVHSPRRIAQDIQIKRHQLRALAVEAWLWEQRAQQEAKRQREALLRPKRVETPTRHKGKVVQIYAAATPSPNLARAYAQQRANAPDPTALIISDEADRLKTASLEQVRDIFDHGDQFLEARAEELAQLRELLQAKWTPSGTALPEEGVTDEAALAAIIRVTGGNFRLLHRLLTQIARLVEINALQTITSEVVEAARESLVIGTAWPDHYANKSAKITARIPAKLH